MFVRQIGPMFVSMYSFNTI